MATKKPIKNTAAVDEPEELLEADGDENEDEETSEFAGATGDYEAADDDREVPIDDHLVDYSVKSREATRLALNSQIEEFLARGGRISQVDANVSADPPRKPTSSYGSRPI